MLTPIATALAGLVGGAVILLGAWGLRTPQAATGFGIPNTPTHDHTFRAWLAVKSVRDIASGILVLTVLAGGTPHLLGWVMLAATAIPVGDMLIVLRSNGPKPAAYAVHGATAAVMLLISLLLLIP